MSHARKTIDATGSGRALARLAEAVGKLVGDHLRLSRLELVDDARAMALQIGVIACFSLVLVVGYALLCGAIAILAGRWMTPAGGWILVGGINIVVGGFGLRIALAKLRFPRGEQEEDDPIDAGRLLAPPEFRGS